VGDGECDAQFLRQGSRDVAVPLGVVREVTFLVYVNHDSGNLFLWHGCFSWGCVGLEIKRRVRA
jgi:hypothetical protein